MTPTLEQDVEALAAEIADEREAEALQLLFEVASRTEWQPEADTSYKPFVYPH